MVEINRLDESEETEVIDDFDLAQLGELEGMSIQHFRFKPGSTVPEHSHHQEQIGFVYNGELTLTIGGEEYLVGPGDAYILESNEPHSGENQGNEDVEGIDIFSPPREVPNWVDDE